MGKVKKTRSRRYVSLLQTPAVTGVGSLESSVSDTLMTLLGVSYPPSGR